MHNPSLPPDRAPDHGGREAFAAELLALARRLRKAGTAPYEVLLELGMANAKAGCPLREVLSLVRQLPGLEGFDPVAAWHERWKGVPPPARGYGIELEPSGPREPAPPTPTPQEFAKERQGRRLAGLVEEHKDQLRPVVFDLIAEDVGALAGQVLTDALREQGKGGPK